MGKLIYSMNVSLDGYVETSDHSLDWGKVDDELHNWFNDQSRAADAFLYGRRMYELMSAYWPTAESDPAATESMLEFAAIWRAKPKIVFSNTLQSVGGNDRLVAGDVGAALAKLRSEFAGPLDVGGPTLAAEFMQRGLIDEYQIFVHPVVLGGGTSFFSRLDRQIPLRLIETRTFQSGVVYLGYATA